MRGFVLISTLVLGFSVNSRALRNSDQGLYLDLHGSSGYTVVSQAGLNSSPTLVTFAAGATVAYAINAGFLFGLTSDYRFTNQYSALDSSAGNFRGTRFNLVSPTIGYRTEAFIFKFDYQFLGNYALTNPADDLGTKSSFSAPSGFRLGAYYRLNGVWSLGAFWEAVTFSKQIFGSSETTLGSKLTLSQYGIEILWSPL